MLRALRAGETVGLLPDQVPPDGMGVWAPFFGRPAYTMTLAARLVQQTGAPALLWCERLPGGGASCARAGAGRAELPLSRRGEAAAGVVNRAMEQLIRQCPRSTCGATTATSAAPRARAGLMPGAHRRAARACWPCCGCCTGCRCPAGGAGARAGPLLHALARSRRACRAAQPASCACPSWTMPAAPGAGARALRLAGPQPAGARLLWHASPARLKRLIRVEGDMLLAERSERPVMWLVPHFLGAGRGRRGHAAVPEPPVVDVYQAQSNPVFDAAMMRGRSRFGRAVFSRATTAPPLVRAIKRGHAFFNLPDMDFGLRDAAFVPFFGVPAATLLAPSRMARSLDMVVQPVVAEMLPGGQGWRVRFLPLADWPSDDALADARRMNRGSRARSALPGAIPVGAQALQDPARGRASLYDERDRQRPG
jgi:KDO2-lipid IV(A) lauroyltransferase